MGLEIVEQVPNIDAVVIPVGGGGLIAGVALAVKALYPHVKVIVSLMCAGGGGGGDGEAGVEADGEAGGDGGGGDASPGELEFMYCTQFYQLYCFSFFHSFLITTHLSSFPPSFLPGIRNMI